MGGEGLADSLDAVRVPAASDGALTVGDFGAGAEKPATYSTMTGLLANSGEMPSWLHSWGSET